MPSRGYKRLPRPWLRCSRYDPILIEQCDLHMGTRVQYSARIGAASWEDADALCAKLMASGGACIVQKTRKPEAPARNQRQGSGVLFAVFRS